MCCMALTADCMACANGMPVEEYCKRAPTTKGCPVVEETTATPTDNSPCKGINEAVMNAEKAHSAAVDKIMAAGDASDAMMQQMERFAAQMEALAAQYKRCMSPSTLTTTAPMCCKALTANCMACAKGMSVDEYCKRAPTTVGCTAVEETTAATATKPPQGKFQLLHPAAPYYPFPRGNFHTRGNIWSFTVG